MYLGPSDDLNNTCDCISKQDSKSLYTFSVSVAKTQDGKDKPKCGGVELVNTLLKRGKKSIDICIHKTKMSSSYRQVM